MMRMFYWCISLILMRLSLSFSELLTTWLCWTEESALLDRSSLDFSLSSFSFFSFSNLSNDSFSLSKIFISSLSFSNLLLKLLLRSSISNCLSRSDSLSYRISRCKISSLFEGIDGLFFSNALSKYWFSTFSSRISAFMELILFSKFLIADSSSPFSLASNSSITSFSSRMCSSLDLRIFR